MASDELFLLSLIELAERIRDGDLSPVEVTDLPAAANRSARS